MRRVNRRQEELADLDRLVEEIVVDAYGESEQLTAFCQALSDEAGVPCDAFVVGVPVAVTAFDYDGNERRGITARCRMEGGAVHVVAAADVSARPGTRASRYLAAYRRWLGLEPVPAEVQPRAGKARDHKASESDLDLAAPLDLVVLALRDKAARCRLLGSDRTLTLRAERLWSVAPGEILTVQPRRQWRYAGHPYLSGEIVATKLDAAALGLVPLGLEPRGEWDPDEAYWGEERDPLPEWAEAIIAALGPRSRWSRFFQARTLTIPTTTRSSSPTSENARAIVSGRGRCSWTSARRIFAASMRTHTSATWSSMPCPRTRSGTTRWA